MTAHLTEHAALRAKQRLGWNLPAAQRMAQKALDAGLTHAAATGPLRRWIDGLYLARHNANNVRLYGEHAYLFHNSSLMTIISIPKNLNPIVRKLLSARTIEESQFVNPKS